MKKIVITFIGLLMLVTFGCGNDEKKESNEKTGQTTMETQDKSGAVAKEAVIEEQNKNTEMADETVKKPEKKPMPEGC